MLRHCGTGMGALWLAVHWLFAAGILSLMASNGTFDQPRRGTRVPLKVVIAIGDGAGRRTCEGETIVVSLLGALIATTTELTVGMRISIHVYLTNKRAAARVVYVDPENPLHCGIALDEPRNIWGVSMPHKVNEEVKL
jgi:PilZ domain